MSFGGSIRDMVVATDPGAPPVTQWFLASSGRQSRSWGDPHLITGDGLKYEFQKVGEFVALESDDGAIDVQVRQAPWATSDSVSVNVAVAADVGGDRVGFYVDGPDPLLINGGPVALAANESLSLAGGGTIQRLSGSDYQVIWPSNSSGGTASMEVTLRTSSLNYELVMPSQYWESVEGLFGDFDGDTSNDLQLRGGLGLAQPVSTQTLYGLYADSWRITASESLFDYGTGESTATFTDLSFPTSIARVADLTLEQRDAAAAICDAAGVTDPILLDACILDVALTGDNGFAADAAGSPVPAAANDGYYFSSFDNGVGPEWAPAATETSEQGGEVFLGSFGNDNVTLNLSDLPPHSGATVTFDLYVLGSWDGNSTTAGPDRLKVLADGGVLTDATFSNVPANAQSFPDDYPLSNPAQTAAVAVDSLGTYGGGGSSIYSLTYTFDHWREDLELELVASNLTDFVDERWGIDDVEVAVDLIQPDVATGLVGVPMSGSIELPGAQDIYQFDIAVGTELLFAVPERLANMQWALTAPSGAIVFDDAGFANRAVLGEDGSYQLVVTANAGFTGDYTIAVYLVPEAESFAISVDQQVTTGDPAGAGSLEVPGAIDVYRFTPTATEQAFFDVSCFSNMFWSLEEVGGATVFDSYCFDRTVSLTAGTEYELTVRGSGDAVGDYGFKIWSVPDPEMFDIAVGDSVSDSVPSAGAGRIETPGARDVYHFDVTADTRLIANIDSCFSGFWWHLRDFNGGSVAYASCADLDVVLPVAGEYELEVAGSTSSYGPYAFELVAVPDEQIFSVSFGERVGLGGAVTGAGLLATPGETHQFDLQAAVDDQIYLDSDDCNLDMTWKLERPDGTQVFSSNTCQDHEVTIDLEGTYTITVTGDTTGAYGFTPWLIPDPEAFAIAVGDTVTIDDPGLGAGSIESPGAVDSYTFVATDGDRIVVEEMASASNLEWILYAPSGSLVAGASFWGSQVKAVNLSETGTYTLTVSGNGSTIGEYGLDLLAATPGGDYTIAVGDTVSPGIPGVGAGTTSDLAYPNRYSFQATGGDILVLDAISCSGVDWSLLGPNGNRLRGPASCYDTEFTIAETGTHVIETTSDEPDDTDYSFELQTAPTATINDFAITVGDTIADGVPGAGAGNLESYNSVDTYRFTAIAGDEVLLRSLGCSGFRWGLADPAGNPVALSSSCYTKRVDLDLDGEYTLTIYSASLSVAGPYSFAVEAITPTQQDFTIALGDTVSDGSPAVGAGNIEDLGAVDTYEFEATANEIVTLLLGDQICALDLQVILLDPVGTDITPGPPGNMWCSSAQVQLSAAGTYQLVVSPTDDEFGPYDFALQAGVGTQTFDATTNSVISAGAPAPGAGVIEGPFDIDEYTISTTAGSDFKITARSCFDGLRWLLVDSNNRTVASSWQCDVTRFAAANGTDYTLTVLADTYTTPIGSGTYELVIEPVTGPDKFPVNIGDTISEGDPGTGAGAITEQFGRDAYNFGSQQGDTVMVVFDQCFDGLLWNITPGPLADDPATWGKECAATPITVTSSSGANTLTVWSATADTGTYEVRLEQAGNDEHFAINVDDTITAGSAGTGSGEIEALGGSDRYAFTAPTSEYVSATTPSCPTDLSWELVSEGSTSGSDIDLCQGYALSVTPGDRYTLVVTGNSGAGTYSFTLRDGPAPQEFDVTIGSTVSDGIPAAGAGNIEQHGSVDHYNVTDGNSYVQLTNCAADFYLSWYGGDLDDGQANCGDQPVWLPSWATVQIQGRNGATGTYQLAIAAVP